MRERGSERSAPTRAAAPRRAPAGEPPAPSAEALEPSVGPRGALVSAARLLPKALLGALLGLAVAELALRVFTPLPTGTAFSVRAAYDLDDTTIGPYMAGAHIHVDWPPETAFEARFNSLGCRGPEPRAVAAPAILAVGDSLTFGLGVQDDQSWPAYLDQMLADRGTPHPVVNLSSAFLMIDDEIHYLERALPVVKPGIVVLLLPPAGDGGLYDEHGHTQHELGFEREREARYSTFGFLRKLALSEARFYTRVWRQRQQLEGAGQFPPRLVGNSDTQVAPEPGVIDRYLDGIREFKRRVEAAGATLVLASFPQAVQDDHQIHYVEPWSSGIPKDVGALGVDVTRAFDAQPDGAALSLLPYDAHASAAGNRVIARSILDFMVAHGLIQ